MNFQHDFKDLLAKHGVQGGLAVFLQCQTLGQAKGQIAVGITGIPYEGSEKGADSINLALIHLKACLDAGVRTLPQGVFDNPVEVQLNA